MKKFFLKSLFCTGLICLLFAQQGFSQITSGERDGRVANTITSAVPFLLIAPDSRAGGMGDVGVATSPDINSIHWNPSKLAFVQKGMGVSVSYTPWLRKLTNDINLSYLSFYSRVNKKQTLGISLVYFSLGNINFTDINGESTGSFNPHEFSLDAAYSLKLSDRMSGGVALRYIYSNLTGGAFIGSSASHAGQAVAGDLSLYYTQPLKIAEYKSDFSWGLNISNIGNKVSYTQAIPNFLPINLRAGTALNTNFDDYNKLLVTVDINKLLIPSPSVTKTDSTSGDDVTFGAPDDISVAGGMFGSFSDAPGNVVWNKTTKQWEVESGSVLKEELHEFMYSIGAEYWYNNQFALRSGYFYEHATKGNRKYFTFGLGLKLNVFGLDFAYLLPSNTLNHPLANTMRFTLTFDFDSFNKQNNVAE